MKSMNASSVNMGSNRSFAQSRRASSSAWDPVPVCFNADHDDPRSKSQKHRSAPSIHKVPKMNPGNLYALVLKCCRRAVHDWRPQTQRSTLPSRARIQRPVGPSRKTRNIAATGFGGCLFCHMLGRKRQRSPGFARWLCSPSIVRAHAQSGPGAILSNLEMLQ